MCFTVQLSRFLSFFFISDSFYIISKLFLFVKNFFNFLKFFLSSKIIIPDRHRCILATFFILTPCKVFVNSFLRFFSFFLKTVHNFPEPLLHRSVPCVSRLVYNSTPSLICKPLNYKQFFIKKNLNCLNILIFKNSLYNVMAKSLRSFVMSFLFFPIIHYF